MTRQNLIWTEESRLTSYFSSIRRTSKDAISSRLSRHPEYAIVWGPTDCMSPSENPPVAQLVEREAYKRMSDSRKSNERSEIFL
ncbi:MAG: hypothetical protein RLZZ230_278 [Candidatus Parcubacteria bacterium]